MSWLVAAIEKAAMERARQEFTAVDAIRIMGMTTLQIAALGRGFEELTGRPPMQCQSIAIAQLMKDAALEQARREVERGVVQFMGMKPSQIAALYDYFYESFGMAPGECEPNTISRLLREKRK